MSATAEPASESRVTALLNGARHRERFLRITGADGVRKYPAEAVGESIVASRCRNGVVLEQLAPHAYNVFMTTIDDGRIVMFMHACVDERGTVKGRYEYNAFALGVCSSDEQAYIDEILESIAGSERDDVVDDYWDLADHAPVPHPTCRDDSGECVVCAVRACPFEEPFHLHHDGCPACSRRQP